LSYRFPGDAVHPVWQWTGTLTSFTQWGSALDFGALAAHVGTCPAWLTAGLLRPGDRQTEDALGNSRY